MAGVIKWKRKEPLEKLEQAYKHEKDGRVKMRIWAIWQMRQGATGREVSRMIGVEERTVYRWLSRYQESGLAGLSDKPKSGRAVKVGREEVGEEVLEAARNGKIRTLTELQQWIKHRYKVNYSLSGLWYRANAWGLSWKVGRRQNVKADILAQESFKKKVWLKRLNRASSLLAGGSK